LKHNFLVFGKRTSKIGENQLSFSTVSLILQTFFRFAVAVLFRQTFLSTIYSR
jgi:hypothetical protein